MSCQILVTRPGAVTDQDKATLRECGVVVVETENLAHIRLLDAEIAAVNASGMLWAAMQAINDSGSSLAQASFAKYMASIIKKPGESA